MSRPAKRLKTSPRLTRSTAKLLQPSQPVDEALNLEALPPEVLEMIMRQLPYEDLGKNVRCVSKKLNSVATIILNTAFNRFDKKLKATIVHLEEKISLHPDDFHGIIPKKVLGIIESLRGHHVMLRAVTWRYTHPPREQRFGRLCFYAGKILDELEKLLSTARTNPSELIGQNGPARCVIDYIEMCKLFQDYFEMVTERKVNSRTTYVSGCKLIDILDCLIDDREVLSFEVSSNRNTRYGVSAKRTGSKIVTMKIRYTMHRAWFTCLPVARTHGRVSWRDEQRYMYLRLRRLVCNANEYSMEKVRQNRETITNNYGVFKLRPRMATTYSGYGEYAGKFFYYGSMSQFAYEKKFKVSRYVRRAEAGDSGDQGNENQKPVFDLVINVELRCSLDLAPLAVRSMLSIEDLEQSGSPTQNPFPEMYLKMTMNCPASVANRLPGNFTWKVQSPRTPVDINSKGSSSLR